MGRKLEKTIKDIVDKSHNAYKGKFWNRHIKAFQRWKELEKWQQEFDFFCSRMWLVYCDENNTIVSNHLTLQEYTYKYENWLVQQFKIKRTVDGTII